MGRNAAFGRPRRSDPLRQWWDGRSSRSRINAALVVAVGAVVVALLMAATAHDASRTPSRANATPTLLDFGPGFSSLNTVVLGDLHSAASPATPADPPLSSPTSTTTTTVVVARTGAATTPPASTARAATTTAPATTVPTSGVVLSEAPAPAPTTTAPPVTVAPTPPTTTTTPPTTPPTTAPATTTTTVAPAAPLSVGLPPLLGPG